MSMPNLRPPEFLIPLLAAVLTGCTVGPAFKAPELIAPADWNSWHGGAAQLAAGPQDPAVPAESWWQSFNDPTLTRLVDQAARANQDLRSAALRFDQSRVQRLTVTAQRGPQVNASASATRDKDSENGAETRLFSALAPPGEEGPLLKTVGSPYSLYQAGFDASWELDLWGRVRRSVEAADADVDAAAATLAEVRLTMEAEVARNYFELRGAQQQLRLTRTQIATGGQALGLAQAQAHWGLVNELAVTQQEALLAVQRARLPQLQAQEAQACNQITLLLDRHPGDLNQELADNGLVLGLETVPDLSLGLPGELARRRPDIRRAEAVLRNAVAGIGIAQADLYPKITLGATFGLQSTDTGQFAEWSSTQWTVGPSLSIPVFDQGRRRAIVKLRGLQQQEAAVDYQQTVLKAWHEIDDDLSAYQAERQRGALLAVQTRSAALAFKLAQARYGSGLTDYLTELDARRVLLQAEQDQADSGAQLFIHLVAIHKALGGSSQPPGR
jgi:NodT family efflux transporter outer membrane factor (OMF) lipoprotein